MDGRCPHCYHYGKLVSEGKETICSQCIRFRDRQAGELEIVPLYDDNDQTPIVEWIEPSEGVKYKPMSTKRENLIQE